MHLLRGCELPVQNKRRMLYHVLYHMLYDMIFPFSQGLQAPSEIPDILNIPLVRDCKLPGQTQLPSGELTVLRFCQREEKRESCGESSVACLCTNRCSSQGLQAPIENLDILNVPLSRDSKLPEQTQLAPRSSATKGALLLVSVQTANRES